jgi:hypothetical protein
MNWLNSVTESTVQSPVVQWVFRNFAWLWGGLGWLLAAGDIFGKGTSLVSLFRRYVYPRPITVPDSEFTRLRNFRFGQELIYPRKWLRQYPQNGDGSTNLWLLLQRFRMPRF